MMLQAHLNFTFYFLYSGKSGKICFEVEFKLFEYYSSVGFFRTLASEAFLPEASSHFLSACLMVVGIVDLI